MNITIYVNGVGTMSIVVMILVGIGAYILGVFGFAQIIGSIQNVHGRGIGLTLFTIILWSAILVGGWFLMHTFAPAHSVIYYIATGVSLIQILGAGRIQ